MKAGVGVVNISKMMLQWDDEIEYHTAQYRLNSEAMEAIALGLDQQKPENRKQGRPSIHHH